MLWVRLALDKSRTHEGVNGPAHGGRAPPDCIRHLVQGCGLPLSNSAEQLASRSLGPLCCPVGDPSVHDGREPRGERRRRVREGKLLHNNSLNSNKVVRVKPRLRLRFSGSRAMPRR